MMMVVMMMKARAIKSAHITPAEAPWAPEEELTAIETRAPRIQHAPKE